MQRYKLDELDATGAILLGRVTYQIFASFWPTAPNEEGFADRMNALPKYVVTKTLKQLDWANSHVLDGDIAEGVRTIKEQPGEGDLLLLGSADVLDALLEHELVDELRLEVFPVMLGSGKRLFRNRNAIEHMQLRGVRSFESGVVLLSYRSVRVAPTSEYVERFAWSKEMMRSFEAAQNTDRILATVLFTDIVDSTGKATSLGDREWRRLIDRHDTAARTEVERLHGRVVKTTGDGILPGHIRRADAGAPLRLQPDRRRGRARPAGSGSRSTRARWRSATRTSGASASTSLPERSARPATARSW